jgi:NADH-quinone oxidoreductase subunit A
LTPPSPPITGFPAIAILLLIAMALAGALICVSVFLGPKKPTAAKTMPYESGMTPVGSTRQQFGVHYYLIAVFFVLFDIETIFMYPWAIQVLPAAKARQMGGGNDAGFLLLEMAIFIVVLFVGYIYLIKKGALEWD